MKTPADRLLDAIKLQESLLLLFRRQCSDSDNFPLPTNFAGVTTRAN